METIDTPREFVKNAPALVLPFRTDSDVAQNVFNKTSC
jgi:hypothetical protein